MSNADTVAGLEARLAGMLLDQHQDEREIRQLRWQVRQRGKLIEATAQKLDALRDSSNHEEGVLDERAR
jgi:hypothetical protein